MRLRQIYEAALIECNKVKAPSILLDDFIYLFNKAIQQYINSVYNRAEYNQQSSDDLNFLQTVAILDSAEVLDSSFGDPVWRFELPKDYLHLLNCKVELVDNSTIKNKRCNSTNKQIKIMQCSRLTADLDAGIIGNYYMQPSSKRPYYYIVNRNESEDTPTNKSMDDSINKGSYQSPTGDDNNLLNDMILKENGDRTANQSPVFIEIHAGNNVEINKIQVAYIKAPMYVSMTEEQIYQLEDDTQIVEFPDYICYEIINIFVRLVLENVSDPRLQTNIPVNQTIGLPASK